MTPQQWAKGDFPDRLLFQRCPECGGRVLRSHRKRWERLFWVAALRCRSCSHRFLITSRALTFSAGPWVRCPRCGTTEITRIPEPDPVDPMHAHWLNSVRRLLHGKLYHCRYCRIQFYDLRKRSPQRAGTAPGDRSAAPGAPS